jgi:hypothetical protein
MNEASEDHQVCSASIAQLYRFSVHCLNRWLTSSHLQAFIEATTPDKRYVLHVIDDDLADVIFNELDAQRYSVLTPYFKSLLNNCSGTERNLVLVSRRGPLRKIKWKLGFRQVNNEKEAFVAKMFIVAGANVQEVWEKILKNGRYE